MRVAKLITIQLTARVIVDGDVSEYEILQAAMPKLEEELACADLGHLVDVIEDEDVPYGTIEDSDAEIIKPTKYASR